MKANMRALLALLALAVPCAAVVPTTASGVRGATREVNPDDGRGTNYHVNKEDNICGLDEPRQISRPAKVDYTALLAVTDEVKQIKRKKIDPNSAKGIDLMSKARAKVLTACETVRSAGSYCSVWKKISLRDSKKGTKPADITAEVKIELAKV